MPGLAAVAGTAPFALRWSQTLGDAVADLAWSADGHAMLIGNADGMLHRFDDGGQRLAAWQGHEGGVTRLQLKPGDDQTLASAGEDGRVLLWDSASGAPRGELIEEGSWVEHLAWTPDGKVLAAAAGKSISLWRNGESLGVWYDARRQVLALSWAPDSKRLATAANKGLYLWRLDDDAGERAEPVQLLSFPGAPVAVAWQPRGQALAVGTQDGFLQVWRQAGPAHGQKSSQLTMRGYPGKVACLAWHPNKALVATAGGPDVVLWDVSRTGKGAKGQPLRHHRKTVTALAWAPDGSCLASGDRDGGLCLWDRSGAPIQRLDLQHEISVLRWRERGRALAIGDTGGSVHLLDSSNPDETITQ